MNMPSKLRPAPAVPPLVNGDRLTAAEFDRRYEAMPEVKKAELIEGRVYMGSPVSWDHAAAHAKLVGWLSLFAAYTPGTEVADNASVRLQVGQNRPQPDVFLRIAPGYGGQSANTADGKYVEGPPELVAEAALSSANYDLHDKLYAFRRNGVQEYVVWRIAENEVDWFALRAGEYRRMTPDAGVIKSKVFPGLWLDVAALLRDDLKAVLKRLEKGLRSPEQRAFVAKLARKAKKS